MTFPRVLRLSAQRDALLTPPIHALEALRRDPLTPGPLPVGPRIALPGGSAEISILSAVGAPLRLDLIREGADVSIVVEADGLEILDPASGPARYRVNEAAPTSLRVFVDTGSVEVHADGGRWTGTRRTDPARPFTALRLTGSPTSAQGWARAPIANPENHQ